MVKRKAEVDAGASLVPNRRSSRHKPSGDNVKSEEVHTAPFVPKAKATRVIEKKQSKSEAIVTKVKDEAKAAPLNEGNNDKKDERSDERQYWLMKAEPETRIERGHDISFSIDDLAGKTSPEPWDGIRNYAARNNLRAMKKGDLAFFYHSSCKIPAIVGIMEIVQEHSPDFTAQDPKKPYYDPKDNNPESPKWSVVHVEFRRKFQNPVTLSELKEMVKGGNKVLANMDLLGKGRLSVGKVSKKEWEFIMDLVAKKDGQK